MIFVTGYHASGKSFLARKLASDFNLFHVETSAIVRAAHAIDAPERSLGDWARDMEHRFGEEFFDDMIVDAAAQEYVCELASGRQYNDIIITGNRSLRGIRYAASGLSEKIPFLKPEAHILYIDADESVAYERFKSRNRHEGDATMSLEDYREITLDEDQRGLNEIRDSADYCITNNGTLEDLVYRASEMLGESAVLARETYRDYRHV